MFHFPLSHQFGQYAGTNLVFHKPTWQGSVLAKEIFAIAVDGSTKSCAPTNGQWWAVDMEEESIITDVEITTSYLEGNPWHTFATFWSLTIVPVFGVFVPKSHRTSTFVFQPICLAMPYLVLSYLI